MPWKLTLPRVHYPETGLSLQQMLVAGASEPDTAPGRPGGAPGSLRPQELEVISKLCLGIRVRSGDHVTAAQVGFDPCLQAWARRQAAAFGVTTVTRPDLPVDRGPSHRNTNAP